MKTSVIFSGGIKQVVLTPENDDEKFALKLITGDDNIEVLFKSGYHNMYIGTQPPERCGKTVNMCQGGYLRMYDDRESLILVLTPKEKP